MAPQLPDDVRLLRTLTGQDGEIGNIGWSPDGRLLATPSLDGTVCIWDTDSGAWLRTIRDQGEPIFAFSLRLLIRMDASSPPWAEVVQACGTWTAESYVTGSPAILATPSHSARTAASWRA